MTQQTESGSQAPHPGSQEMPQWSTGELIDAPKFDWKNLFAYLGPGLLMGGAAIGGGEWLTGPTITAKFGGGLMWLATLSILGQVVYNLEISRYTLYTGEPIFTGKFRTMPGPRFWLGIYLLLDIGSIFPYLAASAATPCAALFLHRIPNPDLVPGDKSLLLYLSYAIFLVCFIPLIFGGKIYNALKAIMTVKIVVVMGFLIVLGIGFSKPSTWTEIGSGFFKIGNVPIKRAEDLNKSGQLDAGEDWDRDGHLDMVEPELDRNPLLDTDKDGQNDSWPDFTGDGQPERFVKLAHLIEPDLTIEPPLDTDKDGKGDSWPDFTGDNQPERFLKVTRTIGTGQDAVEITRWWPDLDQDGKPDPKIQVDFDRDGTPEKAIVIDANSQQPINFIDFDGDQKRDGSTFYRWWPDLNNDGWPDKKITIDFDLDGTPEKEIDIDYTSATPIKFIDFDGDDIVDGDNLENVFQAVFRDGSFPIIDLAMIGFLSALVGISGQGGLSNTPISNYTRDQGWGMGHHVGAIPSMVGGHNLKLSHEGTVFLVTDESLPRWRRWYQHLMRDQLLLWAPACFFGIALPSMLSVEFLKRGFRTANEYQTACMTADGVRNHVSETSPALGNLFWMLTIFCGCLVLIPTMASSIDGIVRRWVDVFWTSSPTLRKMKSGAIRYVYFAVLSAYCLFGLVMLGLHKPMALLLIATSIYNFALGFSCWHTLWLNHVLLPKQLRPNWFMKISLLVSGIFFWMVGTFAVIAEMKKAGYF